MDISLNGEFEAFINEQLSTGAYNSANDIIKDALSLLISNKKVSDERIKMLSKEIDEAWEDFEAGKYEDGHKVMRDLIARYE